VFGASSASKGKFNRPIGIVTNSHGVAYVTNAMSKDNKYWVSRIYPSGKVDVVLSGQPLDGPLGIAVDSKDTLYIANAQSNNIVVLPYGSGSAQVIAGGISRFSRAQLINPQGIAVGAKGEIYVTNGMNNVLVMKSGGSGWEVYVELETAVRAIVADTRSGRLIAAAEHSNQILLIGDRIVLALVLLNQQLQHAWGLTLNGTNGELLLADFDHSQLLAVESSPGFIRTACPLHGFEPKPQKPKPEPTGTPTRYPTLVPTTAPTAPTTAPTAAPTVGAVDRTAEPTRKATPIPTLVRTDRPTDHPTDHQTDNLTARQTDHPTDHHPTDHAQTKPSPSSPLKTLRGGSVSAGRMSGAVSAAIVIGSIDGAVSAASTSTTTTAAAVQVVGVHTPGATPSATLHPSQSRSTKPTPLPTENKVSGEWAPSAIAN
jgi:hypothetical protein